MTTVLAPPRPTRRRTAIARKRQVRIGPADHGRRMSLDQFAEAIAQEGYLYELNKGVIEVSGIPNITHGQLLQELRDELPSIASRTAIVSITSAAAATRKS